MIRLSYHEVVYVAEKLVEAFGPDYIYRRTVWNPRLAQQFECRYFEDLETPSCGVGHILAQLGLVPDYHFMESLNKRTSIRGLMWAGVISCDRKTEKFLDVFQNYQDKQVPWGECLRVAIAQTQPYRRTNHLIFR